MYHRHDGDAYCSYFDTFTVEVVRFTNPFPSLAASFSFALRLSYTRAPYLSHSFSRSPSDPWCAAYNYSNCATGIGKEETDIARILFITPFAGAPHTRSSYTFHLILGQIGIVGGRVGKPLKIITIFIQI